MNICDAKEIPYVDFKWDAETVPPVINMHPHPDAIASIFVDLIREWDWKGFTIVYESGKYIFLIAVIDRLLVIYTGPHRLYL